MNTIRDRSVRHRIAEHPFRAVLFQGMGATTSSPLKRATAFCGAINPMLEATSSAQNTGAPSSLNTTLILQSCLLEKTLQLTSMLL